MAKASTAPTKRVIRRNPLETTITASIPVKLKRSLAGRAKLLDRDVSPLVRYALDYQEQRGWKDIPLAVLSPGHERVLKEWLDSSQTLEEL